MLRSGRVVHSGDQRQVVLNKDRQREDSDQKAKHWPYTSGQLSVRLLARSAGGTAVLPSRVAPKSPRRFSNQGKVIIRDLGTSGSIVDMCCGRPEISEMEDCGWE